MLSIHVYCCIKFNVLVISSFCTTLRYKEVDFTEKLYSQNYVSISSECFRCERYSTVLLNNSKSVIKLTVFDVAMPCPVTLPICYFILGEDIFNPLKPFASTYASLDSLRVALGPSQILTRKSPSLHKTWRANFIASRTPVALGAISDKTTFALVSFNNWYTFLCVSTLVKSIFPRTVAPSIGEIGSLSIAITFPIEPSCLPSALVNLTAT
ncbi:hypothetical protein V1477_014113 [Vespula maculifrons]|uniref:Uncharacterized protein n=1 Tax=Vespula maculifrons TaxID=7453 RepID=A0ABD2BK32_VESMC